MRTFLPTVCKLRRYHHHSFNINLKTDSIWYHTRNWDWSIPERCSRKPWRKICHPGLQLQQHGTDAGHYTGLRRNRVARHPAGFERSTQVCEPDHPALHGTGSRGVCQGLGRNIPICLHLDHGDTFELCKSCIDMGFSSVMIDGSHLPYDENVALTRKVVEYAHQFDVTVEGEPAFWPVSKTKYRPNTIPTPNPTRWRISSPRPGAGFPRHLDRHIARGEQVPAGNSVPAMRRVYSYRRLFGSTSSKRLKNAFPASRLSSTVRPPYRKNTWTSSTNTAAQ